MESKVGRGSPTFYVLKHDEFRLAYLWDRRLLDDTSVTPRRQRLEFYEMWNGPLWQSMFGDLDDWGDRTMRFIEYVGDGDITLESRVRLSPHHKINVRVYDPDQIVIRNPSSELFDIMGDKGMTFPKSLLWSNLHVKEHYRLATTWKKEEVK